MLEPRALLVGVAGHRVGSTHDGCRNVVLTLEVATDGVATDKRAAGVLFQLQIASYG